MVNVAEALDEGTRHQEAGQWADAERLFRQILDEQPDHAEALYRLGTLAVRAGAVQQGIQLISAAIRADRSQAAFHVNLGEAFRRQGDLGQAIHSTQQAIQLEPDLAPAHANLGLIYQQQGNLAAAADCYREAARLTPDDPQAHAALGRVLFRLGQLAEAEACFRRAVSVAPHDPSQHRLLGIALHDQGKLDESVECFHRALELDPNDFAAHNSLGTILQHRRAFDQAEQHYRRAIMLQPNFAEAQTNLGALLANQDRAEEALSHFLKASQLMPNAPLAFSNLAGLYLKIGQLDESIKASRHAIELNPDYAAPHRHLGVCLHFLGQTDRAIQALCAAVRLDPVDAQQHSTLLYTLNYHSGYDPQAVFAEHRAWAARHADPLTAASAPHANDRTPGRRLRVGYVSPHFREHAVNFFSEPILASHDHEAFEIFCYADVGNPDDVTRRLQPYADQWRDIVGHSDLAASDLMRRDQIDVLVDLAGHIIGNRLTIFAHKPAPIQVTYLGYQNTTGMRAMDYRLTDAWSDPPDTNDEFYIEKLVRLPGPFFCYRPSPDAPPPGPLPALTNGHVTFGSFNFFGKVNLHVLDAWAEILRTVERSRLILLAAAPKEVKPYVLGRFERQGIGADRIELCELRPNAEYLKLISQVDIALDPFPLNGHTTTCDALWMGVPVVTLAGRTYASRFGGSALVHLGLRDLIAESREQYFERAVQWARDVDRLRQLRGDLRPRMAASPLVDARTFTRGLEAEYRRMWVDWCMRQSS